MRIGLIVPAPHRAADDRAAVLERHAFTLAQADALAALGAEVVVFVAGVRAERVERGGATVEIVAPPSFAAARTELLGLVAAAAQARLDVVHVFHWLSAPVLATAVLLPVPVFAEHNGGAPPEGLRRGVVRLATRRLAGLFFTARAQAEPFLAARALSRATPILSVPELSTQIGPGDRLFARTQLGLGSGPVVLVIARASPEKNPFTALEAFRLFARERPEARLCWAARDEGPLHAELVRRIAADPELASRVTLQVGVSRAEMPAWYAAADVAMFPSLREVCGHAFVEALATGTPVVGSQIPAFGALARGDAARLVPAGDAAAFARVLLETMLDTGASLRARTRFVNALSHAAIAARKLAAYRGEPIASDY